MKLHELTHESFCIYINIQAWCQVTHVTSSRLMAPAARKKQVARRTNISRPEPKTNGHGLCVTHTKTTRESCPCTYPINAMHPRFFFQMILANGAWVRSHPQCSRHMQCPLQCSRTTTSSCTPAAATRGLSQLPSQLRKKVSGAARFLSGPIQAGMGSSSVALPSNSFTFFDRFCTCLIKNLGIF